MHTVHLPNANLRIYNGPVYFNMHKILFYKRFELLLWNKHEKDLMT
jgi:hypothetical protein